MTVFYNYGKVRQIARIYCYVETSFSELKQKDTVNVCDGKRLGKVCDVVFTFPEGKVKGIVVPGGKGFRWVKSDLFIDLKNIVRIGEDVVLVELKEANKCEPKKNKWDEERPKICPPQNCPPPAYRQPPSDRRDYGEYE